MTDLEKANPVVTIKKGKAITSSRDVAVGFEKRHGDVLRDIDNLLKNLTSANLRWFIRSDYADEKGETRRAYDMTRDGFTLLAMGFTGQRALHFKLAYIQRFNEMEQALQNAAALDLEDPAFLRATLLDYTDKVIARFVLTICHWCESVWIGPRKPLTHSSGSNRTRQAIYNPNSVRGPHVHVQGASLKMCGVVSVVTVFLAPDARLLTRNQWLASSIYTQQIGGCHA